MSQDVLDDPAFTVPRVPDAARGVAWLRAHVPRFSEGETHRRRRALAERLLATVDLEALRCPGHPVAKLAAELGLPRDVVADVRAIARSYQPDLRVTAAADEAVARLVSLCGGRWDELAAARIGLLVQAGAAMDATVADRVPPVPFTRRLAPDGTEVRVALDGAPFGSGRHACPGRAHALALAEGTFHRLHHQAAPLLLPNAWDFASGAALVRAGFTAIGTTSLGVAAAAGLPDASGLARTETVDLARRLVRLPAAISVDIEAGFGDVPGVVADLAELGVEGINLEDGQGYGLAEPEEQARLIRAAKTTAPHVFLNARVDTHWLGVDRGSTIERARAYLEAGADGIFVPGVATEEVGELVAAVPAPLNVLAGPPVRRLAELGVRRISTGSLLFRAGLAHAVATALAVRDGEPIPEAPSYTDVQALAEP